MKLKKKKTAVIHRFDIEKGRNVCKKRKNDPNPGSIFAYVDNSLQIVA